jgi:ribosome-associated heat shock protein Hsp15
MRIDKFLWSVRFYKTRSIATEEIKKNRVSIGGQVVKSSKEVTEGDVITIRKNQIDYKIKVIQVPKSRIGAKLVTLHIKDMTDSEQYALLESRDWLRIITVRKEREDLPKKTVGNGRLS